MKTVLSIFVIVFAMCRGSLAAQTLSVPSVSYSTIQSAIDDANNDDTIIVSAGLYVENIDFLGKAITLTSTDPNDAAVIAATIIDGSAPNDPNIGSVVTFKNNEDANSVLTGFTIRNGSGQSDQTVWWRLWDGDNGDGGGVFCSAASPTITKNVIRDCEVVYGGGGVFCNNGASPEITENTFLNNYAGWYGGGVFARLNCSPRISNNIFRENECYYLGGAIYLADESYSKITNNYFEKNNCQILFGGAIYYFVDSAPTIACNFFIDNTSTGLGHNNATAAAIMAEVRTAGKIINNLFMGNSCPNTDGCVIKLGGNSSDVVANNIIYANGSAGIVSYGTVPISNNNIYANQGGNYSEGTPDQTGINGNISQDPQINGIMPEPFISLELNPNSPCIDTGGNGPVPGWLVSDYDGTSRIVNGTVDMGPQEYRNIGVPQDYATIQAAIDAASTGSEIIVSPGVYQENVNFLDKDLKLRSLFPLDANCVGQTIIDGNQIDSCIKIVSSQDASTVVAGLRLQNGRGEFGGGVCVDNTSGPILMYNYITQNYAVRYGGGIDSRDNCYTNITNNTIIDNDANDSGGGIGNGVGSTCIIQDNKIIGNSARLNGGGIYSFNDSDIDIMGNEIADNNATGGGGIYQADCNGIIQGNTLTKNIASDTGGAISIRTADTVITNNLVYANRADKYAGIFVWSQGSCQLRNNTVLANVATDIGGGISVDDGVTSPVTNNIVAYNGPGGGIYVNPNVPSPSVPVITHNNLWANIDGNYLGDVNDLLGINGNISVDPCFVETGSWVDLNDPNVVVEPNDPNALWLVGDYRIVYYSDCRDAGSSDNAPQIDFDDKPRPYFADFDIGAYELQVRDISGSGSVDLSDLFILSDSWLSGGSYLPADLDNSNFIDFHDFALLGAGWKK
jgi:hypothetical protein